MYVIVLDFYSYICVKQDVLHMTFQKGFYGLKSGNYFNEKCIVVTDVVMTLLVPVESVM